jgi:hypothetical protein
MKKMKYLLFFTFEATGVVENAQIIGAIFKQIDGLFWPNGDLGELNERGRVGWIDVETQVENNKTHGTIQIPLDVDLKVAALVGASIETVTNISAFPAKVTLEKIEDVYAELRKRVSERAKEILLQLENQIAEKTTKALEELKKAPINRETAKTN